MYSLETFITVFISILAIFFPIYFNLKRDIDDYKNSELSKETKVKLKIRKKHLLLLYIIVIIMLFLNITLYISPKILNKSAVNGILSIINLKNILSHILPCRKEYFQNFKYKFSFITETILCFTYLVCFWKVLDEFKYYFRFILLAIESYFFIFINNFFSFCLLNYIKNNFILLSIITNIVCYISFFSTLTLIITHLVLFCDDHFNIDIIYK